MAQDPLARDQRSSLGIACSALTLDHPHLPTEVTKSIGQGLMGTTWNCCLLEFLRPSKGRGQIAKAVVRLPTRGSCGQETYSAQLTFELLQLHEGLVCVLLCLLQVAGLHGVHHGHLATRSDGGGHQGPLLTCLAPGLGPRD